MRTISVEFRDDDIADIGNGLLDGIESLAERVRERIFFRLAEWFLDTNAGVDYDLIQGHQTTLELAAATITEAIRDEGGAEITAISTPVVQLDRSTRSMTYKAEIDTIYGAMPIEQELTPAA